MKLRAATTLLIAATLSMMLHTRPAAMAAPSLILFHGSELRKPVFVASFEENAVLMLAVTQAISLREDALEGRPFIEVAMFWGPEWHQYLVDGKPVDVLKPRDANQHARIYPATDGASALFVFSGTGPFGNSAKRIGLTRRINASGVAMLKKHSVIP